MIGWMVFLIPYKQLLSCHSAQAIAGCGILSWEKQITFTLFDTTKIKGATPWHFKKIIEIDKD